LVSQIDDALEAAERKMRTDEEAVTDIKAKIFTLKREREREREMSRLLMGRHSNESDAELETVLEAELEQAHKLDELLIPLHGEPSRLPRIRRLRPWRRTKGSFRHVYRFYNPPVSKWQHRTRFLTSVESRPFINMYYRCL